MDWINIVLFQTFVILNRSVIQRIWSEAKIIILMIKESILLLI